MDQINQKENSNSISQKLNLKQFQAPEKLLGLELNTYRSLSHGATSITFLALSNIILNPFDRLKTLA